MILAASGRIASTRRAPVNLVLPVINGTGYVGETLVVNTGNWSAYPVPTYTYQWKLAGVDIVGATTNSYTVLLADVGSSITCAVTASNGVSPNATATSAGKTATASAVPSASVQPAISGSAIAGSTLTVSTGTWTATPAVTSYTYQWRADSVNIQGATTNTYTTTTAQAGVVIDCVVTATNLIGSAPGTSTNITVSKTPASVTAPTISGTAQVGFTLTRTNGTYTGSPTPTVTGAWYADGVAISPAQTASTLSVVSAYQGKSITWVESADNGVGSAASQTSNALTVSTQLTAPSMAFVDANDNPPSFAMTSAPLTVGYTYYLEIADNSGFSGSTIYSNTVDINEQGALQLDFAIGLQSNTRYYRMRYSDDTGVYSDYSASLNHTYSAQSGLASPLHLIFTKNISSAAGQAGQMMKLIITKAA